MSDVEKIKERLPLAEVIGSYVELEKAGGNFRARCPFHNEKTPSFYISPGRNLYYCFGCGAKGDLFTFIQEYEGLDFYKALTMLADRAGVKLSHDGAKSRERHDRLYKLLLDAAHHYRTKLKGENEVREILRDRGVDEKSEESFMLGYASGERHEIIDMLIEKGYSHEEIRDAGLSTASEKGEIHDRFRDRLMFPIWDSQGRIVGFSGRLIKEKKDAPKYLNSPETELFKKSEILYGFDRAKGAIRKGRFSILVEGQFDLVLSHQAGFPNTVATSGTSVTNEHLRIIQRISSNVLLAFDNDSAGYESMRKVALEALSLGMNVKVALLPKGKDPADIVKDDASEWKKCVRESVDVIRAFLSYGRELHTDSHKYWKYVNEVIIPMIARMPNAIDRAHFLRDVHEETDIPLDALEEELRKAPGKTSYIASPERGEDRESTATDLERLDILFAYAEALLIFLEGKAEYDELKERIKTLVNEHEVGKGVLDEKKEEFIFELERKEAEKRFNSSEIEEIVHDMEKEITRQKLRLVEGELKRAEKNNDTESIELLKRTDELSKQLKQ